MFGAVTPDRLPAGSAMTTFTLTGSGFTASTQVAFDGIGVVATLVDFNTLTFTVPATLLALPGPRRLTITNGGPGGGTAAGEITVVLEDVVIDPMLPAGIPALFDGAAAGNDPARTPVITYPENDAVAPRDFPAPVVSWNPAAGNTLCRLRIAGPAARVDVFADVSVPPPAWANTSTTVEAAVWSSVTGTSFDVLELSLTMACANVVTTAALRPSPTAPSTRHRPSAT